MYQNVPCAVPGQRCSPPAGEVLGESRDHDLESFLTELMGAHGHAVVFNKRFRQCLLILVIEGQV